MDERGPWGPKTVDFKGFGRGTEKVRMCEENPLGGRSHSYRTKGGSGKDKREYFRCCRVILEYQMKEEGITIGLRRSIGRFLFVKWGR